MKIMKLTTTASPLTKYCFTEEIDSSKVRAILLSKELLHESVDKQGKVWDDKEQLTKILKKLKNAKSMKVKYSHSAKSPFKTRLYPNVSASVLRSELRGVLLSNYIDCDINNCHPAIALQLLLALNMNASTLEHYVLHREETLQKTMREYYIDRNQRGLTNSKTNSKCSAMYLKVKT